MKTNLLRLASLVLFVFSPLVQAQPDYCENQTGLDALVCNVGVGALSVVGRTTMAVDDLRQKVVPWTPVKVQLQGGSIVDGTLSPMAVSHRDVQAGDTVLLRCEKTLCELRFTRKAGLGDSPYARNSPRYGEQAAWGLTVSEDGVPQASIMKIEGKVPLDNNVASQGATPAAANAPLPNDAAARVSPGSSQSAASQ